MKKVILYGVGAVFQNVIRMLNPKKCQLIAVADMNRGGEVVEIPEKGLWWDIPTSWKGMRAILPATIKDMDFDYVLLCSDLYVGEMRELLVGIGIPENKIISASNNDFDLNYRHFYLSLFYGRNTSNSHKVLVELTDCEIFDHTICRELMLRRERLIGDFQLAINDDYVRLSTLELLAARIRNMEIEGSVAEAGVYKGDTAKYLNQMFSDRKLYLFDSFDSFNTEVMAKETCSVSESFIDAFKDTSVDLVMSKMKHPEQCIIRKGIFPDTAEGLLEEKWAFVSLDMDLYESTYAGLKYFYPKLSKGGYIIVHDCLHHQEENGFNAMPAGRAVDRFCLEEGIQYVPVTDVYGSVIITK